jgi:ribose transport system permease protein
MYLIGGGENVARNSGIPVKRYKVYAFTLSGLVAGLGGLLAVARLGAAGPAILDNGLNLLGVSAYPQLVIKGAVVIAAVLVSQNRRQSLLIK